ncbi:hypothetical protein AOT82_798 [Psychrobacter sp. AntiMn-1]|nr:hypothetical protein AOT82_798 [Psychrobacter sp. AntiMn-1]
MPRSDAKDGAAKQLLMLTPSKIAMLNKRLLETTLCFVLY